MFQAVIRPFKPEIETSKDFDTEEDYYDQRSVSEEKYNYKWEEKFKWLTKMEGKGELLILFITIFDSCCFLQYTTSTQF